MAEVGIDFDEGVGGECAGVGQAGERERDVNEGEPGGPQGEGDETPAGRRDPEQRQGEEPGIEADEELQEGGGPETGKRGGGVAPQGERAAPCGEGSGPDGRDGGVRVEIHAAQRTDVDDEQPDDQQRGGDGVEAERGGGGLHGGEQRGEQGEVPEREAPGERQPDPAGQGDKFVVEKPRREAEGLADDKISAEERGVEQGLERTDFDVAERGPDIAAQHPDGGGEEREAGRGGGRGGGALDGG